MRFNIFFYNQLFKERELNMLYCKVNNLDIHQFILEGKQFKLFEEE